LKEKITLFQSIKVIDQLLQLILSYRRLLPSRAETFLPEISLTIKHRLWHQLGKYYFSLYFVNLSLLIRHNQKWIPACDDTLNSTSRRYGTETQPQTHPHNHAKYEPNETTFRSSFLNPKRRPS